MNIMPGSKITHISSKFSEQSPKASINLIFRHCLLRSQKRGLLMIFTLIKSMVASQERPWKMRLTSSMFASTGSSHCLEEIRETESITYKRESQVIQHPSLKNWLIIIIIIHLYTCKYVMKILNNIYASFSLYNIYIIYRYSIYSISIYLSIYLSVCMYIYIHWLELYTLFFPLFTTIFWLQRNNLHK